jgi:hypothetical protein
MFAGFGTTAAAGTTAAEAAATAISFIKSSWVNDFWFLSAFSTITTNSPRNLPSWLLKNLIRFITSSVIISS